MFNIMAALILYDHVFILCLSIYYLGTVSLENAKFEFILMQD